MEQLLAWDQAILLAINGWHSTWADLFMWNISSKWTWIPLYVVLIACLIRRYGKRSIWYILAIVACVGLADYIASGILKETVMRLRPSHEPTLEGIVRLVNGYKSGLYGFVSSHAANTVGICLLFSLIWRDWRATLALIVFAVLNCYSRMYLGVHYPLDILGGATVGILVALGLYYLLDKGRKMLDNGRWTLDAEQKENDAWSWAIVFTLIGTLIGCALLG